MEIKKTICYEIEFIIQYFEDSEGGMLTETYKDYVNTLEEAVHLLECAAMERPGCDWVIVCNVKKNGHTI